MKVIVTLTITGDKETVIEGDAGVFDTYWTPKGELEDRQVGFWLDNYRFVEPEGKRYRKGRVFCPWTSVLYVQTKENEGERCQ